MDTRDRGYRLGVLLGDGVAPEIVPAAVGVADAAVAAAGARQIRWVELPMGAEAISAHGTALPRGTLKALGELDGWVLGPHDSAGYPEPYRSVLNPSGSIRSASVCTPTPGR